MGFVYSAVADCHPPRQLDIAMFVEELGHVMQVKTAELKNNLSKYLRRVQETGESITICDRDKPVAVLSPVPRAESEEDRQWLAERERILKTAKKLGIAIRMPLKRPRPMNEIFGEPPVAPDGRTDIKTIDLVRGGRDY